MKLQDRKMFIKNIAKYFILTLLFCLLNNSSVFSQWGHIVKRQGRLFNFIEVDNLYKYAVTEDEFLGNSTGSNAIGEIDWGKVTINSGSGFSDSYSYSANEPFYSYKLSSGTVSLGGQAILFEGLEVDNFTEFVYFIRLRLSQTTNIIASAGLSNNVSAGTNVDYPSEALYFWYDSDSTATWKFTSEVGGARTTYDLGVAPTTGYVNLAFFVKNSLAYIYTSNLEEPVVLVASGVSIPSVFVKPHVRIQNRSTVINQVYIGYFLMGGMK